MPDGCAVGRDGRETGVKLHGHVGGLGRDFMTGLVQSDQIAQKGSVLTAFHEPRIRRRLARRNLRVVHPFEIGAENVAVPNLEQRTHALEMVGMAGVWNALVGGHFGEPFRAVLQRELSEGPRPEKTETVHEDHRDEAADHHET